MKLLPEITTAAVLLLSAGYVEMEKIRESYLGVVHGKEVWIYWGCLSAGYILLTEVMLELLKDGLQREWRKEIEDERYKSRKSYKELQKIDMERK